MFGSPLLRHSRIDCTPPPPRAPPPSARASPRRLLGRLLRQRVLAGLDVLLDVRVVLVEAAARGDLYRGLPVLAERRIGVVLDAALVEAEPVKS
jgi:hypothetical protein